MGLQLLDLAKTKERIAPASRSSSVQFKAIGLTVATKEPDVKALEALMAKNKNAQIEFLLSYDGTTIEFYGKCASTKVVFATLALAKAGKPGVQRAIIEKLIAKSIAADKGDLDKFNKLHPPPPTVDQQGKLNQGLAPLRMELRDAKADVTKAEAALAAAQAKVKAVEVKIKPWLAIEEDYKKRWAAD